jgi:hypothetical protein
MSGSPSRKNAEALGRWATDVAASRSGTAGPPWPHLAEAARNADEGGR